MKKPQLKKLIRSLIEEQRMNLKPSKPMKPGMGKDPGKYPPGRGPKRGCLDDDAINYCDDCAHDCANEPAGGVQTGLFGWNWNFPWNNDDLGDTSCCEYKGDDNGGEVNNKCQMCPAGSELINLIISQVANGNFALDGAGFQDLTTQMFASLSGGTISPGSAFANETMNGQVTCNQASNPGGGGPDYCPNWGQDADFPGTTGDGWGCPLGMNTFGGNCHTPIAGGYMCPADQFPFCCSSYVPGPHQDQILDGWWGQGFQGQVVSAHPTAQDYINQCGG